jgi:hypothetical protein
VACNIFSLDECRGVPSVLFSTAFPSTNSMTLQITVADCHSLQIALIHEHVMGLSNGGLYNNRPMPYPMEPTTHVCEREPVPWLLSRCIQSSKSCFSTEAKVYLTHGDLLPRAILVECSEISTGITDQETAQYYPGLYQWEYCRMHYLGWMTPHGLTSSGAYSQVYVGRRKSELHLTPFTESI